MTDNRLCFVAMPFSDDLSNTYDVIESVAQYCALNCVRADKISQSRQITDDINSNIEKARVVIADLSGNNPNVFYEVGLAHGRGKRVVLMVQNETVVPFDLRGIRYLRYDAKDLNSLRTKLIDFLKTAISTIPSNWEQYYRPAYCQGSYIKVTSVDAPASVQLGHPIEIRVTARNTGKDAKEGYFSISFPDGAEDVKLNSNVSHKIGLRGDPWCGDRVLLRYPIAEGFSSGVEVGWPANKENFISVSAYAKRKGLLWYYVSASSFDRDPEGWSFDPEGLTLDKDQRSENVYCGVIEVI